MTDTRKMREMTATSDRHFFRLPRELRDLIYTHLSTRSAPARLTHKWFRSGNLPAKVTGLPSRPLQLINKQFRDEYTSVALNTKTLVVEDHIAQYKQFKITFTIPRPITGVRTLHLKLHLSSSLDLAEAECHECWITQLLQKLPNLCRLELDVVLDRAGEQVNLLKAYNVQLDMLLNLPHVKSLRVWKTENFPEDDSGTWDYGLVTDHIATWAFSSNSWLEPGASSALSSAAVAAAEVATTISTEAILDVTEDMISCELTAMTECTRISLC
ncbi:hypothetical protein LTR78_004331 [Recurvomyces mirabilis]|uniref:Uncharacterized protein n=1 Tax=Recurvomyces mirabilis TaxID=574656 RepID=A0AAE0WPP7_9PEZI|nr:hypothetical protein LTR78_004331 [Recurvomyces mirabilis]KAK5156004.1 hypothetical protein LTS14_005570 [Recurvomyces mirabilis]